MKNSLRVPNYVIETVLLECIYEWYQKYYHTMTVLLEYMDCFLQDALILLLMCLSISYYTDIMLNAFNDPLCWHNRQVPKTRVK